jgi:hypothetical protein
MFATFSESIVVEQTLYWDFLFTWFNAVFTTLPIMTVAFTDEHASERALLKCVSTIATEYTLNILSRQSF